MAMNASWLTCNTKYGKLIDGGTVCLSVTGPCCLGKTVLMTEFRH